MQLSPARITVALVAALVLALAASSGASAFSLTGVTATPQVPSGPLPASGPTAAGAHPNLTVTLDFSDSGHGAADSVEGFVMHLAPGIVSYVNHVARCSTAAFGPSSGTASSCPAGSAVGSTTTNVTGSVAGSDTSVPPLSGTIYNVDPPAGSPAALGIDISTGAPGQDIKLIAVIGVDPHDLGLTATLHGLPNTLNLPLLGGVAPVHVDRITQTLLGYVAGKSFFANPTSCIPAPIRVDAVSHAGAHSSAGGSYTPTDCAHVPFSTTLTIDVDPPISDWTSTVTSDVKPGASDIPRVNSHVKSTTVVLPESLLLNPALAARLDACTDAQFALHDTSVAAKCPPSSAVGDISFVSPILGAFPGKAYFGTSAPGDRLRLFLDVPLFGAHIKVSAHVRPSRTTGQITTVFDLLPQVAFTDFQLTFHGGPRSALVTPTKCGTHTATTITTPWSGTPPVAASATFSVSFDGKGAQCQRIFKPSMSTATNPDKGGVSSTFTLVANRPDRNVPIGRMSYQLPAGLVGNLALGGLTQCPPALATKARCPASSRIGTVRATAGSGTDPPTLGGAIFLTEPKVAGDPAGLSVAVPAKLGPVDAGTVIVGARLRLRSDGGLSVTSDPIPALQEGIPLALRRLTVTVNRRGFMRNPSSCGTKPAFGHFDALGGGSADAGSTLTFKDCDALSFAPRISAILGSKHRTRAGAHPPFTTVVRQDGGDAAIQRAHVRLPLALASNVDALNAACEQAAFDAGSCSKHAQIATATAISPLFSGPVTGPVYLVKRGVGLPKLVVALRTPIAIQFEGFVHIGRGGRIATTFPTVPDLPVVKFTLRFHGGRFGALAATQNLCRKRMRLPADFKGQNGKAVHLRPRIVVRGCRGSARHRRR